MIKTGGLADVAGALPVALAALGADTRIMLPGYPQVLEQVRALGPWRLLGNLLGAGEIRIGLGRVPDTELPVWVVDAPELFQRKGGPYLDEHGQPWADNHLRFATLARAAALACEAGSLLDWPVDILHAHDWQAGLAPAFLSLRAGKRPATVFTIHNISFPGLFPVETLAQVGLPPESYSINGVEFFGQVSFLKAGIQYSDQVTTVSPTYAREILTEEMGGGFSGLLNTRSARLSGILNGIDTREWNPATDPHIFRQFDAEHLELKAKNREALRKELGLTPRPKSPVLSIVSRFSNQKGLDLIREGIPRILDLGAQMVIQGGGDRVLEQSLLAAAKAHPREISVQIGYNEKLAHRIQAGSDLFLSPARFEPCGLTQLYALRYGTVPVARKTGGLADTIVDFNHGDGGTGFLFDEATPASLLGAIERALAVYKSPRKWRTLQRVCMAQDFSWKASAQSYWDMYQNLLGKRV